MADPLLLLGAAYLLSRSNEPAPPSSSSGGGSNYQPTNLPDTDTNKDSSNGPDWGKITENLLEIGGAIARQLNNSNGTTGYNPNKNSGF